MNRRVKLDFYHSIDINDINNEKKVWNALKPMFSNENPIGERFFLVEEGKIISDDKMIAECLNTNFVNITDSLGLDPSCKESRENMSIDDKVEIATAKYKDHPSIIAIKHKIKSDHKFEFNQG